MIDYLKSVHNGMADFGSRMIYSLIFSILHVTFKIHYNQLKARHAI